jgi:hypothetical protein
VVLFAFAVAHGDGAVVKIQVFDPQAQAFHQPQTNAIEESGYQVVCTRHLDNETLDLVSGQDGGQTFRFLSAQGVNGAQLLAEHLVVEEEEDGEDLILGRGSDMFFHSQVGEEGFDLGCAHLGGVAFVVE